MSARPIDACRILAERGIKVLHTSGVLASDRSIELVWRGNTPEEMADDAERQIVETLEQRARSRYLYEGAQAERTRILAMLAQDPDEIESSRIRDAVRVLRDKFAAEGAAAERERIGAALEREEMYRAADFVEEMDS